MLHSNHSKNDSKGSVAADRDGEKASLGLCKVRCSWGIIASVFQSPFSFALGDVHDQSLPQCCA